MIPPNTSALVASNIAKQTDELVSSAITKSLGHSQWTPADLAGRLCVEVRGTQPQSTWVLDGKPLLEIYPPEVETHADHQSTVMLWNVKYRRFE